MYFTISKIFLHNQIYEIDSKKWLQLQKAITRTSASLILSFSKICSSTGSISAAIRQSSLSNSTHFVTKNLLKSLKRHKVYRHTRVAKLHQEQTRDRLTFVKCDRPESERHLPSVVESDRFPPTLVAPPLSRSLDPRTPLSALQLPRSPACPPEDPAPAPPPTLPTDTPSSVVPSGGCEFTWGMMAQPPLPLPPPPPLPPTPPPLLLPAPGVAAPFTLPRGKDTKDS